MDIRIILSATWIVVSLLYLEGDVFRIFSGDYKKGEMSKMKLTQPMWLGIAVLMTLPIVMVFFSVALDQSAARWANILIAGFFFLFNLIGLPTYPGWYDRYFLLVSMLFNMGTIYYAWNWV